MKTRGTVIVELIILLSLSLGGFLAIKHYKGPDLKAANAAAQATETLVVAKDKQGSVASAYNQVSGQVIGNLPQSPEKSFLQAANEIMAVNLPAPDQNALIQAERLKVAKLEGRLEEADKIIAKALKEAKENAAATTQALAAKRASDYRFQEQAAISAGAEQQKMIFMLIAISAGVLWLYTKVTHLSPGQLATAVNDIKNDAVPAITALDGVTSRLQQSIVSWIAHIKAK